MVKTCPRRNGKRSLPMYSFVLAILLSFLAIAVILSNHVTHADRVADARVTNGIDDNASDRARIGEAFAKLPLSFEADQGKAAKGARFLSRGGESSVFVTSTEMVLALRKSESRSHVLRMKLAGASPNASGSGTNELPGKVNYITGSDPHRWRTDIPTYATVKYENVYPGIDVVYYGNQRQLEYDFRLRPGADPRRIRLAFDGAQHLSISEQGDLVLGTGGGDIVLKKPTIYQEIDGEKHDISGSYLLHGRHGVGFEVGDYDRAKPLVIDPTLVTLKVFGGSGDDRGRSIAVDSSGNAYITGNTTSTDFPTTSPFQGAFGGGTGSGDDFVVKLNPQGTVAYSTYLGGSGNDQGNGIAVDSLGNAYITGTTSSTNFPRANALQNTFGGGTSDAFVTELNATGSALIYSTYLGGSGADTANGIALDSSNNVYITGFTSSINFPTRNALQGSLGTGGSQNAFVTKLNAAGSALVYSTYLGGNSSDTGSGIALDSANNAYVAGFSYSSNFPTMNPFQSTLKGFPNAFVSKLNPAGSALVYSTYLGGSSNDGAYGIAVDASGNAYVTGATASNDFPTKNAYQANLKGFLSNAFVTAINPAGSALIYSTYIGGGGTDYANGITVDANKNVSVVGSADSPDFPAGGIGGGGSFKSTNSASAWTTSNLGLTSSHVVAIQIDPTSPSTLYAATYFGPFKSLDGGSHWFPGSNTNNLTGNTVLALVMDPTSPSTLYAGTQNQAVFKTTDGGNNWTQLTGGLPNDNVQGFAINPSGSSTIFAGTASNGVYKSTNGGTSWAAVNGGLTNSNISALLVDPTTPTTIYAANGGFSNAGVFKSTNSGSSWTSISTGLPGQGINAIAFNPTNSNTIFAAVNNGFSGATGGVYKSTNGGNWTALVNTGFDTTSLAIDPTNPSIIYAGTRIGSGIGLLKSTDGGSTWSKSGLTNITITALAIDPTDHTKVYAGTDGGSDVFVWSADPTGSLISSSFYGGTGADFGQAIALDPSGNPYVAGFEFSSDFAIPSGPTPAGLVKPRVDTNSRTTGSAPLAPIQGSERSHGFGLYSAHAAVPCSNKNIQVVPTNLPFGLFGRTYSAGFSAMGGTAPYIWPKSAQVGPGLTQIGSFVVGTPTTTGAFAGSVRAIDSEGCQGNEVFFINVYQTAPPTPTVTNFAPLSGPPGTYVTTMGNGFDPSLAPGFPDRVGEPQTNMPASTVVKFNGVPAAIASITDTQIVCQVPAGATTGPITVTTDGGTATSPTNFTVTQAFVTVNGRAFTSDGRGLRNATVSITDSLGVRRTTTTSSFGFFSFDNVATGGTYTVRITSRLYRFQPQSVQVNDNLTLPDFVGLE